MTSCAFFHGDNVYRRCFTTADGAGRDVYVYFDNDVKVRAPYDAMGLRRRLEGADRALPPRDLEPPHDVPETARTTWPARR